MNDSMTALVARLYRAGSETSQQTKKLRIAVDTLLRWIKENVNFTTLPCNCVIYPSGEFVRTALSNPPHGTHQKILHIIIGHKHTVEELYAFARLIADGFLEQLCDQLQSQGDVFGRTNDKIEFFLKK